MQLFIELLFESVCAFLATISFSIMFITPKREIFYCGIVGLVGWVIYSIAFKFGTSSAISNFYGALAISYLSRFFAVIRKTPISVFITSGIITLVPGGGIYNTVLNIIMSNNQKASYYGIETIKIAFAIALGIVFVLAMPNFMFGFKLNYKNKH